MSRRLPRAFTLVEMLVVIATIGLLAMMLLPALHSSREAARRTQCLNHLRQLGIAAHGYHAAHDEFPPGLEQFRVQWAPQYRGTSLFAFLLPFLEEGNLLARWNYDAPLENTEGGRAAISATVLPVLLCPSDAVTVNPVAVADRYYALASYGGNGGTRSHHPMHATCDGIFHTTGPGSEPEPDQRPVRLSMVADGTSHTILFGERHHEDANFETFARAYWTESLQFLGRWAAIGGRKRISDVTMSALVSINYRLPFDFEHRSQAEPPCNSSVDFAVYEDYRRCAFGSGHRGGANFGFADGSVRFLNESLSLDLLQSHCTRNGSEL